MNPHKAIELNKESEQSLRKCKFIDHADAILLGNEALKAILAERTGKVVDFRHPLPGEDSFIDTSRSEHTIKKILESPIGREPKPAYKVNEVPQTIFTIKAAQLQAMTFYKRLTSRKDRQPRYTLLTFCGATPEQAYRWRDWSLKHFQLIFDYLFNPEPLADGLVNNRLGLSEAGLKSVAVA